MICRICSWLWYF